VVGNGMAGARFVEEVLERGGGEQFRITVFGDEPHGNYNRIMLSPVLAGEEHEDDIVLNSHDWYADNGVILKAGVRADRIDTAPSSSSPATAPRRRTTTSCSPPAATRSSRR
jgi:nitrite reductase (NADH) large subunit